MPVGGRPSSIGSSPAWIPARSRTRYEQTIWRALMGTSSPLVMASHRRQFSAGCLTNAAWRVKPRRADQVSVQKGLTLGQNCPRLK